MLKLIIASTMQMMYINVAMMLPLIPSTKPQEVGEMIELSYGNNQFLVSFMCWDMFIAPFPKTAKRPNKVGAQEKKTPGLQCAPTKFPFSYKFAESTSSIYDIFQVTGAQGPRSHQREVLCLTVKMQKHNSGQEQLSLR